MVGESTDADRSSYSALTADVAIDVRPRRWRDRAPQVNVVDDVFARCKRVAPTRRAEVLEFYLDSYRHSAREAFGRELRRGTKADAFLFAVVIQVAQWPGWNVGAPGRIYKELRSELTRVLETREPYQSAVEALRATPDTVDPVAVRQYLYDHDRRAYARLGVRQNAAFKHFIDWLKKRKSWFAALIGLVPAMGGAGAADAATVSRSFAATKFGQVVLLAVVPALVGGVWHRARQHVAPRVHHDVRLHADASRDIDQSGAHGRTAVTAISSSTPPALLGTFSGGGGAWAGKVSGVRGLLNGVAWSGTRVVAVGYEGSVVSSPDGETWERSPQPTSYAFADVTYGDGVFVAVGTGRLGTHLGRLLMSSSDGVDWNVTPWLDRSALTGVAYGGGAFVAVGTQGSIIRSVDGEAWDTMDSRTGEHLDGVSYLNGRFVVVGHGGTIMTSEDGKVWERTAGTVTGSYFAPAFGNGLYLAPGQAASSDGHRSMVWTSTDLVTWTEHEVAEGSGLRNVAFAGGHFVATTYGKSGLLVSEDGFTWSIAVPGDIAPSGGDVVWTGSQVIAVGATGSIYVGTPSAPAFR